MVGVVVMLGGVGLFLLDVFGGIDFAVLFLPGPVVGAVVFVAGMSMAVMAIRK